ncbi:hypothetical protein JOL79_32285 [Microbispora sp. RL4-1S]|uniref:DUF4115 domain-containing protein n=1 Tax=Microbispora oryzae TaxID=2806554 RepID=A0A940WML7_9ACTN|nr:hypothetical protein [Microbispora oryzae]MBP2708469.1 hypothetical protein [Microbispora oryzae]
MGRHRSDPVGIARTVFVVLAVALLLALLALGVKSLMATLGSGTAPATATPSSSPSVTPAGSPRPTAPQVPTLRIVCQADRCPVFVRIPGGNVLIDRDLTRGEQASYSDPELDVVIEDSGAVRVEENGTPRPPGQPGERQSFSVTRAPGR